MCVYELINFGLLSYPDYFGKQFFQACPTPPHHDCGLTLSTPPPHNLRLAPPKTL